MVCFTTVVDRRLDSVLVGVAARDEKKCFTHSHYILCTLWRERLHFFFVLLWKTFEIGVSKKPFIVCKKKVDQEKTNASWQKYKKRDHFAFHGHKICFSCTISKTVQKSKFFCQAIVIEIPFLPQFYGLPFRYHGWRNSHGNITNWQNKSSNWMTWPTLPQFKSLAIG